MTEIQETQPTAEGVQASEQVDTNNWEQMARTAQAGNDKYSNLKSQYGDNFEDKLSGFSEFENQWNTDKVGTAKRLAKEAGIEINEQPQAPPQPQGDLNVWELGQDGSQANQWLENQITAKAEKIAQKQVGAALEKDRQDRQVNEWRTQLNNAGVTEYGKQNEAIREFLNPNPDFGQFLKSKVSPQESTPRPSDVMQQVQHNQQQPQSAGVLQGGMPPQPSAEDEAVNRVMNIAKQKAGAETF